MSTVADLMAALELDTSQYDAALQAAEGGADHFSSTFSGMATIGGAVFGGAMVVAGAAAAGLGWALNSSVQEAMDMQDIEVQLTQTLKNNGAVTGVTTDLVKSLADSWSTETKYSDDAIMSAGNVLATFKNINKDAFPQTLQLAMDLATKMGTDLPTAARVLGKALSVPGQGLLRLNAYGLEFDAADKKMITNMEKSGDTAGAQAKLMEALSGAIGGAAEAAGGTASGQWAIFNNQIKQVLQTIGGPLMPILTELGQELNDFVFRPETQAIIQNIANSVGDFAQQAVAYLPTAITWIKGAFGWFEDHKGVVVAALAAMGVAVLAFGISVATAAWAAISPLLPAIAVMLAVAGVAYLVYEAWTTNWGGIRDTLMNWWTQIQPVLQTVWDWLATNIPIAIQTLATWWSTVLIPALQAAWAWIQTNILPLLAQLWDWFQNRLALAIQFYSALWTNLLLPAITIIWEYISTVLWPLFQAVANFLGAVFGVVLQVFAAIWTNILLPVLTIVWNFISGSLWPLFQAVANFLGAVFGVALTALAGLWQNILLPALKTVTGWISEHLQPVFAALSTFVNNTVMPVIQTLGSWLSDHLAPAFSAIGDAISGVIDWFNSMADAIRNFKLPDWLTPGSPTPFETGLWGINDALQAIQQTGTPDVFGGVNVSGGGVGGGGDTYITNVSPHYYRGSEPTLMEELKLIGALRAA